jgi:hypothetical protein
MMDWPSLKIQPRDLILVRGLALEVTSDGIQVRFDDGAKFLSTFWVPTRDCALIPDVDKLPPYFGFPTHRRR